MLDSDRHHGRTPDTAATRIPRATTSWSPLRYSTSLSTRPARLAPLTSTSTLSVLGTCCQTIRDLATRIPTHAVSSADELDLLQLALDSHKISLWAQQALLAHRAPEKATSPAPPPPQPPAEAPVTQHPPSPAATDVTPPSTPRPAPCNIPSDKSPTTPPTEPTPPAAISTTPTVPDPLPPPPERVTIRLSQPTSPQDRPPNDAVVRSFNKVFDGEVVSAVSYSRQGHLVLHLKAPHTIARVKASGWRVYEKCRDLFRLRKAPAVGMESRETWSKVVLHHVPFPEWEQRWHDRPTWEEAIDKLRKELIASNNIDPSFIRDVRPLCRASDHERLINKIIRPYVPIQLSLSDKDTASRLLRDGVVAHFYHCRVSPYRPRAPAATPSSVSSSS
ncbi:hypothetical protein EXIGLDRAFT_789621 [Exidia glandulosa HHB12029]|uniref:Uncharacterized protein n=1 Tax=Exidia glandulosa HHB12029 TaxID=1314781 RepID=A0A165I278_EXIGL|nr:hypothetical protein EXIGLDRAFT_789621 [Exidia glandulosa HHB12029]